MSQSQAILMEIKQEATATRKLLALVPEDKLTWQPHAKAMTLGQLALHVAELPGLVSAIAGQPGMEINSFDQKAATSRAQLLETFDGGMSAAEQALQGLADAGYGDAWPVTSGGKELMSLPRGAALRMIGLNHGYHHRGQLATYLRTLDVKLPAIYGRSADESSF